MKSRIISIVTGSALLLCEAQPVLHAQLRFPAANSKAETSSATVALQSLQPTAPPIAALGPKKQGIIRLGVATPVTQMGQGVAGSGIEEPLRALFLQALAGPTVEAVAIRAVQPIQVDAEGKSQDCDYVLYSSLSQKKAGGTLAMLRTAAPMLSMVPMVGMAAGVGGMIATQAAGVALSGGVNAASAIKAKSELTLTYKLLRPGATNPVMENTLRTKARTDGEDVITPMLSETVAQTLGAVLKKN